jgi:hypothetical protein
LSYLHVQALSVATGEVVAENDLRTVESYPRKPRLIPAEEGRLHLLWLDGPHTERALYHVLVDADGTPVDSMTQVSRPGRQVIEFQIAPLADGGVMILWTTRTNFSLLRVSSDGQWGRPLLLPEITRAGMAADGEMTVHLAWLEQETAVRYAVRYTKMPADALQIPTSRSVGEVMLSPDQTEGDIDGPVIVPEEGGIYVAWAWEVQTLMGVVQKAATVFVTQEGVGEEQSISLSPYFPPTYTPVSALGDLSVLAPPVPSTHANASVYELEPVLFGEKEQAALAFGLQGRTRSQDALQPGLVLLDGGQILGYTYAAWTSRPSVAVSAVGDTRTLYVAWVDAIGVPSEYPVYLATTSESLQSTFSRLTVLDVLLRILNGVQRAVQGIVYFPLAVSWFIAPVIWIFAALWWGRGDISQRGKPLVMGIALLFHLAGRYFLSTALLELLPSLSRVPADWVSVVVYLAPVAVLGLGSGLSWLFYIRRRKEDWHPLPAYLFAAMTDLFISIGLFGMAVSE